MEHLDTELARGFIGRVLAADERAHWEAHLRTCQTCRRLVERERAWAALLKLDAEPVSLEGALERLLGRVEPVGQHRARMGRRRQFLPAAVLAVLLGLVLGLAYRFAAAPLPAEPGADRSSTVSSIERDAVAHLDALQTLQRDPWLAEHYEAVRWLETLMVGEPGG